METPQQQTSTAPAREIEKGKKAEISRSKMRGEPKVLNRSQSRKERKSSLQQDVDKLKKKLRHEENVHRVLKRALNRPLGALPRLPPYLPSNTLELLAEVAVLEEEVVRLEEQLINIRQAICQEAIYISAGKAKHGVTQLQFDQPPCQNSKRFEQEKHCGSSDSSSPSKSRHDCRNRKATSRSALSKERQGKKNQTNVKLTRSTMQSTIKILQRVDMIVETEKQSGDQPKCLEVNKNRREDSIHSPSEEAGSACGPNTLSEEILKCLLSIFSQMRLHKNTVDLESSPSVSGSFESLEDLGFRDPYDICLEFGKRDVGPYKHLTAIDASSVDTTLVTRPPFLCQRLKLLLRKLALVDLFVLNHQQKLAFWINIYNSCMMNAFLEQGVPESPQKVFALLTKAMINVGGHLLSAMAIEHFILRLPYHSKNNYLKGLKSDGMVPWGNFGLDWPEPLVTFALSCGSWSSPAVRVYTASHVEKELETAARDYLQAAIGIAMPNKLAIPKLLDWYLLDFAKDMESLMDWICFELPSELRNNVVECLQVARGCSFPDPVQVMPYEFRFRYLLSP